VAWTHVSRNFYPLTPTSCDVCLTPSVRSPDCGDWTSPAFAKHWRASEPATWPDGSLPAGRVLLPLLKLRSRVSARYVRYSSTFSRPALTDSRKQAAAPLGRDNDKANVVYARGTSWQKVRLALLYLLEYNARQSSTIWGRSLQPLNFSSVCYRPYSQYGVRKGKTLERMELLHLLYGLLRPDRVWIPSLDYRCHPRSVSPRHRAYPRKSEYATSAIGC
jgi:hypothetical protein